VPSARMGRPQDYMQDVVKGTRTMHAVLQQQLPPDQLRAVFAQIFAVFNDHVPRLFARVRPVTPAGRSRVRVDLNFLLSSLRRLRGCGGAAALGDTLERFVADTFGEPEQRQPQQPQAAGGEDGDAAATASTAETGGDEGEQQDDEDEGTQHSEASNGDRRTPPTRTHGTS